MSPGQTQPTSGGQGNINSAGRRELRGCSLPGTLGDHVSSSQACFRRVQPPYFIRGATGVPCSVQSGGRFAWLQTAARSCLRGVRPALHDDGPGPHSALILCAHLRDPGWTEGGVWPMEAALGWHRSDAHGGPPSQMPRPASPPRAESRTQIPSLTSGPIPGPLAVPGSPPDGSAAPPQRPQFGVTRQGPSEEETHLYNKSTNGFLAHDLFLRYLSGMLKVGLKQHMIYQEASLQPEERKNSQDGSEMTLPTAHVAGERAAELTLTRAHVRFHVSSRDVCSASEDAGVWSLKSAWTAGPEPVSSVRKYAWLEGWRAGLSPRGEAELARRTSSVLKRKKSTERKIKCPCESHMLTGSCTIWVDFSVSSHLPLPHPSVSLEEEMLGLC